jgi:hypothetical protein
MILPLFQQAAQAQVSTCAAASSRASGIPSRRRQISSPGQIGVAQFKAFMGAHRSFDEQLQGRKVIACSRSDGSSQAGNRGIPDAARTRPQRADFRGWWPEYGPAAHRAKALDEQRHGIDEVLAVIDHQQHLPFAQIVDHTRQWRAVVYCQIRVASCEAISAGR